jgi:Cu2+-exporting ATPase
MAMENIAMPSEVYGLQEECGMSGASLVMVAIDDAFAGAIAVQPTTRTQAQQVMHALRQQKISTYLISGDQELPTRKLAQELGMDYFAANILPQQKAAIVAQLQQQSKSVCFVGDGINDAIALQEADVSVSLRNATTAAIDTAQIVLMDEQLLHVSHLLEVGKAFEANQKTNLLISIMPGVICVGGVFLLHFGIYTASALFYGALALGIGNTMRSHRLAHLYE